MARKFEEQKAKPANDAYPGMLVVSFFALLIGCGLLYMDYSKYDPKTPPKLNRVQKDKMPNPEAPEQPKKQKTETDDTGKDTATDDAKDTKDKDAVPEQKKDTAK